ncbi:MAG: 8-amino-7-oxononanoate synthase [Sinobacteraceae bacterium]|nr:8-amino-7-oxononanoate synthase [Nevskiaceae bacterium]
MRCTPEAVAAALRDIDARHLRRRREIAGDGRINFCSNDYLGLAQDPRLADAMADAARLHGTGAGASHLISGHGSEHESLEQDIAAFLGRERALVFSTGYMANLGVLGALADRRDLLLADELNHASLIDAARLVRSPQNLRYAHADADAARALLGAHAPTAAADGAGAFVITDGVFSMDGDVAPLPALAAAAAAHAAWLVVDDAHGIGVIGATGRGSCEHFALSVREVPLLIGTFGKALGTFGAFVAGDAAVIELLLQRARTYIYTTALPPAVAAATRRALDIVQSEPWRRQHLHSLIEHFRAGARQRGLQVLESATPIQPLILGSEVKALAASAQLREVGYRVTAIRPPTVPAGTARLRITLSAAHTPEQIDGLLSALEQACT